LFTKSEVDGKIEEIDRVTSMSDLDHKLREPVRMIYKEAPWITCYNYTDRIIGFFIVSPWHKDRALGEFERCAKELQVKDRKLPPAQHGRPLDSHVLLDAIFEKCAKAKIPIPCHGDGGSLYNAPARFGEMADTFPDVDVIMAHMGYWEQVGEAVTKEGTDLFLLALASVCASDVW
jgi:predicted TIM-barrel fold metal-dependent hydrolase